MRSMKRAAFVLVIGIIAGIGLPFEHVTVRAEAGRGSAREEKTPDGEKKSVVTMYRLYLPCTQEHFYTASIHEREVLVSRGWKDEGVGWYAPSFSETPVYRLYHPGIRDHHYTVSEHEKNVLSSNGGWIYEGIGWYSDDSKSVPLYRRYCPLLVSGAHHYTTGYGEAQVLLSRGWKDEGIAWYGVKPASANCDVDSVYTVNLQNGKSVKIEGHYDEEASKRMLEEIISYRKNYGIGEAVVTESLNSGAGVRALEVCAFKSHTRPDGTACISVSPEALAENFMNYGESPEEILAAWKASPSHNGNLLQASYKKIGVSVFARRIEEGGKTTYRYSAVVLQG